MDWRSFLRRYDDLPAAALGTRTWHYLYVMFAPEILLVRALIRVFTHGTEYCVLRDACGSIRLEICFFF